MNDKLFLILVLILTIPLVSGCQIDTAPEATQPSSPVPPTATEPAALEDSDVEDAVIAATDTDLPPTSTLIPTTTLPSPTVTVVEPTPTLTAGPLMITCPDFDMKEVIPVEYACHGEDLSPPLRWTAGPKGTQSFVLIMDDPDAVPVAGYVWDHWVLYNIPADVLSLPAGIPADPELPDGSRHGKNSFGLLGYGGPCPPGGQTHQYVFSLYALDIVLQLDAGLTKEQLLEAIEGHILDQGTLTGVYTSP